MQKELSFLAKQILVRRLGQTDAPWLPIRKHEWSGCGGVNVARMNGADFTSLHEGASTEAERQQFSRAQKELVRAGLLQKGPKPHLARLTAAGLRVARGYAWAYTPEVLRVALNRIAHCEAAGDCLASGAVPEHFIAGTSLGKECDYAALRMTALALVPAMQAGLVKSDTTVHGLAFYALTAGPVSDRELAKLVDESLSDTWSEDLADACAEQLKTSRAQLLLSDSGGEIGPCPIHLGTLRSGRAYDDLTKITPLFPQPAAA